MNKILIGSDEGAYTPTGGARTIVLSELSFTPSIEQIAYVFNKTQDRLYYAPAYGLAKASLSGYTITIDGSFPVLGASDELHIQMWKSPPMAAEGGGNYSNAQGDFTATITASSTNITITGLSFTLEEKHVLGGYIKKIDSSGNVMDLPLTDVAVSGGVITLADASNFASGDTVLVSLLGPDKAYDDDLDANLSYVLNPDYSQYTSVETLISEADLGITATADGTDTDTLNDADGAFDAEDVAVGFEAYSEDEDTAATVLSITDASNIETDAITDWTGDVYWLPECKRFVIPFEGYKQLLIHFRLSTDDADNVAHMKLYATLDADADDTDDTYWVDKTAALLSGVDGYAAGPPTTVTATNTTVEDNIVINDKPYLKWMIKIVGEVIGGGASAAAAQDFDVYIKKVY